MQTSPQASAGKVEPGTQSADVPGQSAASPKSGLSDLGKITIILIVTAPLIPFLPLVAASATLHYLLRPVRRTSNVIASFTCESIVVLMCFVPLRGWSDALMLAFLLGVEWVILWVLSVPKERPWRREIKQLGVFGFAGMIAAQGVFAAWLFWIDPAILSDPSLLSPAHIIIATIGDFPVLYLLAFARLRDHGIPVNARGIAFMIMYPFLLIGVMGTYISASVFAFRDAILDCEHSLGLATIALLAICVPLSYSLNKGTNSAPNAIHC